MKAYVSYAGKGKSVVRTAKVNKSSSAVLETIQLGTLINTAEYNIDSRLKQWGYRHKTVNHSLAEYARDEDDDGFCEVHSNTMAGFWSWLRAHRGISQSKLSLYLGFFEFVHNESIGS